MAPGGPKQSWELLVSSSLARWSMGPRGRNGGWAGSYRCPQPTANSGRERRKAKVDGRFQAIRASTALSARCPIPVAPWRLPAPWTVRSTRVASTPWLSVTTSQSISPCAASTRPTRASTFSTQLPQKSHTESSNEWVGPAKLLASAITDGTGLDNFSLKDRRGFSV